MSLAKTAQLLGIDSCTWSSRGSMATCSNDGEKNATRILISLLQYGWMRLPTRCSCRGPNMNPDWTCSSARTSRPLHLTLADQLELLSVNYCVEHAPLMPFSSWDDVYPGQNAHTEACDWSDRHKATDSCTWKLTAAPFFVATRSRLLLTQNDLMRKLQQIPRCWDGKYKASVPIELIE